MKKSIFALIPFLFLTVGCNSSGNNQNKNQNEPTESKADYEAYDITKYTTFMIHFDGNSDFWDSTEAYDHYDRYIPCHSSLKFEKFSDHYEINGFYHDQQKDKDVSYKLIYSLDITYRLEQITIN